MPTKPATMMATSAQRTVTTEEKYQVPSCTLDNHSLGGEKTILGRKREKEQILLSRHNFLILRALPKCQFRHHHYHVIILQNHSIQIASPSYQWQTSPPLFLPVAVPNLHVAAVQITPPPSSLALIAVPISTLPLFISSPFHCHSSCPPFLSPSHPFCLHSTDASFSHHGHPPSTL